MDAEKKKQKPISIKSKNKYPQKIRCYLKQVRCVCVCVKKHQKLIE